MVNGKCTNCGAAITVDETSQAGVCPYCQTAYVTEKAIKNVNNTTNNSAQVINNYYSAAPQPNYNTGVSGRVHIENDGKNITRCLLLLFLGFLGSFIINHSSLKPEGWTSRTFAHLVWFFFTGGIYSFVAAICSCSFNPNLASNIGYIREF